MCVGLSAKVVRISDGTAVVDAGGAKREVSSELLEDLEPGEYVVRIGNSSRNTRVCGILKLETEIITEKQSHICKAPIKVTEIERQEEKEEKVQARNY